MRAGRPLCAGARDELEVSDAQRGADDEDTTRPRRKGEEAEDDEEAAMLEEVSKQHSKARVKERFWRREADFINDSDDEQEADGEEQVAPTPPLRRGAPRRSVHRPATPPTAQAAGRGACAHALQTSKHTDHNMHAMQ